MSGILIFTHKNAITMTMNTFLTIAFLAFMLCCAPLAAQEALLDPKGEKPIEVEADEAIEWDRAAKQYIARVNAVAIQGENRVYGDILIADYDEPEGGGSEIRLLTAKGNVRIVTPTHTAYGDTGVHDVRTNISVLTGKALKMESKDTIVTARDSLEFHRNKNKAYARGNAKAKQGGDVVTADTLVAYFAPDKQSGGLQMQRVEGLGNVVIVTPQETVTGDKGDYNINSEEAIVTGNVKITRGKNQMNGDKAVVNMKTGVSRLISEPRGAGGAKSSGQGRVRALLFTKDSGETE